MTTVSEINHVKALHFNPDSLGQRVLREAKTTLDRSGKPHSDIELRAAIQQIAQEKINSRTRENTGDAVRTAIAYAMGKTHPAIFRQLQLNLLGRTEEKNVPFVAENSEASREENATVSSQVSIFLSHYYAVAFFKTTNREVAYLEIVVKNPDLLLLPQESSTSENKTGY